MRGGLSPRFLSLCTKVRGLLRLSYLVFGVELGHVRLFMLGLGHWRLKRFMMASRYGRSFRRYSPLTISAVMSPTA